MNAKDLLTNDASADAPGRDDYGITISVVRAHEASSLVVGQQMEVRTFPVVLGRSLDAGVRLADRTVSREHALLDVQGGRLRLVPLSDTGKVWVDNRALTPGEGMFLEANDTYVQLGGVLLRIDASVPTEPFQQTLAAPTLCESLLHFEIAQEAVVITLGGKLVPLHRGPAFILAALAATSNVIVNEAELLLVGGGQHDRALERNLNQLITYARTALAKSLDSDPLVAARVIDAMRTAALEAGDSGLLSSVSAPGLSGRDVARHLIRNQRNFGYVLRLPAAMITIADHRALSSGSASL